MYTIAYANLCKVMSTIKVEVPTEPEGRSKVITFRRVLLTRLQQEFEKDMKDDEERERMLCAIKETEDVSKMKFGGGGVGGRGGGIQEKIFPFISSIALDLHVCPYAIGTPLA